VQLEGLGQLKKSTSSELKTCDLPACGIVPQPTVLPQATVINGRLIKIIKFNERLTLPYSYIPIYPVRNLPFSRNQICLLDEGLLNLFHTQ
jgi:hypothetical protein